MDIKPILLQLQNLVGVLDQVLSDPFEDHAFISDLLNNASHMVKIPPRRYVLTKPLILDKSIVSKRIVFDNDAILFFVFEKNRNTSAFIVNSKNCTLVGGTFVTNNLLFEVNGSDNVVKGHKGIGNSVINGSDNLFTFNDVLSSCDCAVSVGDTGRAAITTNFQSRVESCFFACGYDLYEGICHEKWTFMHALVLYRLITLCGNVREDWVSYDTLYTVSSDRLCLLHGFLYNDDLKIATNKHAKKVLTMIQSVVADDDTSGYAKKFFMMVDAQTFFPDKEIFVLELIVLWETKSLYNTQEIIHYFTTAAKEYAIENTPLEGVPLKDVARAYLSKYLGWVSTSDSMAEFEKKFDELSVNVRDQMIQETHGLNGLT